MKLDQAQTHALLERYDIRFAGGDHPVAEGSDIVLDGWINDAGQRVIRARSAAHGTERLIPLGEVGAIELIDGLRAHGHHLRSPAARRMLAHLFQHASDLFEESGIDAFSMDPVRLHENEYTVVEATFSAPSAMHVEERLTHHAHDRKSFHASGQQ